MHLTRAFSAIIVMALLAGCGAAAGPTSTDGPGDDPGPPPEEPGRGMVEPEAIERLTAYGAEHPDSFGGLYLDQDAGGQVVMLFTRDVERHARAVTALAGDGVPVRVRQVRHTEAELMNVLDGLDSAELGARGVEMVSAGIDVVNNVVTLEARSNVPGVEQRLEARYGGRLAVTIHPVPGPWANAEAGDGWRLLADGRTGSDEAFAVRAATDASAWRDLWEGLGLPGEAPAVDLESEVVVSFGHGIGSSCPELRLDGVDVRRDLVFSVVSDPLAPRACTADLVGAVVFVVAIEREAVSDDGFTLRLTESFGDPLDVSLE